MSQGHLLRGDGFMGRMLGLEQCHRGRNSEHLSTPSILSDPGVDLKSVWLSPLPPAHSSRCQPCGDRTMLVGSEKAESLDYYERIDEIIRREMCCDKSKLSSCFQILSTTNFCISCFSVSLYIHLLPIYPPIYLPVYLE